MICLDTPPASSPSYFLTGATGFLGGALAAELLGTPEWPRVLLLVRAENEAHAYQRVLASVGRFVRDRARLARIEAAQILIGDFTEPAAFIADPRLTTITRVVHGAGPSPFGSPRGRPGAYVEGTLRFAHHLRQVADLERFIHVSTALVCGDRPPPFVREDNYPRPGVTHFSPAARRHTETERLLRLTLPGFPLVIARPSLIVGHSRLGCGPAPGFFWAFRLADSLGMITGRRNGRVDVIPVDYAAQALRHLLLKPRLAEATYHLSASWDACCSWSEIAAAFARSGRGLGRPRGGGYRTATTEEIAARRREFDLLFGPCDQRMMMRAVRLQNSLAQLDTVFDATRLRGEGLAAPPRFTDYIEACQQTSDDRTVAEQIKIESLLRTGPGNPG